MLNIHIKCNTVLTLIKTKFLKIYLSFFYLSPHKVKQLLKITMIIVPFERETNGNKKGK